MGGWGWPAADVTASLLVHVIPKLQAWDLDHYVGIRAVGNLRTVPYPFPQPGILWVPQSQLYGVILVFSRIKSMATR